MLSSVDRRVESNCQEILTNKHQNSWTFGLDNYQFCGSDRPEF